MDKLGRRRMKNGSMSRPCVTPLVFTGAVAFLARLLKSDDLLTVTSHLRDSNESFDQIIRAKSLTLLKDGGAWIPADVDSWRHR